MSDKLTWRDAAETTKELLDAMTRERDELRAENRVLEAKLAECERWVEREEDELRAENERLREAFENSEVACLIQVQMVRARLAESEAENDQWQKKVAELWAERERGNTEWREQIQAEHAAYQELRAENGRLRAALEKGRTLVEAMDQRMPEQATEDADGFINSYRIPVGPWHRLLGWSRGEAQSLLIQVSK